MLKKGKLLVICLIYVDDILLTGNDSVFIKSIISQLSSSFPVKDLGPLHFFLGLEVKRDKSRLFLSQSKYALDLLKRTNMVGAKPCHSPACPSTKLVPGDGDFLENPTEFRSLVGGLQYLTWTRPEISFAVNQVCQHMQRPTTAHMTVAKRILRYIKGTVDHDILFNKGLVALQGFSCHKFTSLFRL